MAESGPLAPKLPTMHKLVKTKATDPPQQNPQPQLEPETIVPPDQVPDSASLFTQKPPAFAPPAYIPDPVQPQNPPAHVPILMQPQNTPAHVPNPVLPPAPPVQIP